MATRVPTITQGEVDNSLTYVTWSGLLNGDDGTAVRGAEWADRSIHFLGTFGVGGSISLEGTNEATPTNWIVLTDPQGNAITKTAPGIEQVLEVTRWIRVRVTAGDGTTDITAIVLARRANSLRT
jgi:hypothetical protein